MIADKRKEAQGRDKGKNDTGEETNGTEICGPQIQPFDSACRESGAEPTGSRRAENQKHLRGSLLPTSASPSSASPPSTDVIAPSPYRPPPPPPPPSSPSLSSSSYYCPVSPFYQPSRFFQKPDEIEQFLFLGGINSTNDSSALLALGIRSIITVADGLGPPPFPQIFSYLTIKVQDHPHVNLNEHFEKCFEEIRKRQEKGEGVLVHCLAGMSRSATIVIGYLMQKYNWSLTYSFSYVRKRRKIVQPNFGFMRQLREMEERMNRERGDEGGEGGEGGRVDNKKHFTVAKYIAKHFGSAAASVGIGTTQSEGARRSGVVDDKSPGSSTGGIFRGFSRDGSCNTSGKSGEGKASGSSSSGKEMKKGGRGDKSNTEKGSRIDLYSSWPTFA